MSSPPWMMAFCAAALLYPAAGCAPRVRITAQPGPEAEGIRYYRPKPYLKIVPAEIQIAKDASRIEPGLVTITLEYLPDFSEEYAIDVRPGLGVADVSLKLEDGWNLTEISQDLDSQTDENVSAAGDLIKAVSGLVPTSAATGGTPEIEFTVPASDVPLGFYESVIGRGPDGRKRLYGFRYLGFLPYQSCPTVMGGIETACCGDPQTTLYGLTFEGGTMVFKPLPLMVSPAGETVISSSAADRAMADRALADRVTADRVTAAADPHRPEPVHVTPSDATPSLRDRSALAARIELDLRAELRRSHPHVGEVRTRWEDRDGFEVLVVQVRTTSESASDGASGDAIRRLALAAMAAWLPGEAVDVEVD